MNNRNKTKVVRLQLQTLGHSCNPACCSDKQEGIYCTWHCLLQLTASCSNAPRVRIHMSYITQTQPDCVLSCCLGCNNTSICPPQYPLQMHTQSISLNDCGPNVGEEEENISGLISSSSGRLTFENALAMQYVSGDNHCVEVLGEARSAWGFEELACLTPLRNRKDGLLSTGKLTFGQKSHKPISEHFDTDAQHLRQQ